MMNKRTELLRVISLLVVMMSVIGIADAALADRYDKTKYPSHKWRIGVDHGSFSNIQHLVGPILLVDPSTQNGPASFTGTGGDAMGHVFTGIIPPGPSQGLGPTHGDRFVILNTGNASDIIGDPGDFLSTAFVDEITSDTFRFVIPLKATASEFGTLSFDSRFMSEEDPNIFAGFNDNFRAFICNNGNCAQVAELSVANNFIDPVANPGAVPSGTKFDWSTSVTTTTVDLTALGLGIGPDVPFTLEFEIADVGDGIFDSAVLLDKVKFGPGNTEIPEFPTIVLPVAAALGIMFLFSRRKRGL